MNNTPLPNQAVCKNNEGELIKASVENDSLYFIKNNFKQVIVPVKNKSNFNSIPAIAVDKSDAYKNRIYICWSDEKNGLNNKDVFIVYSDDSAKTWTEPILITYRPNHKDQFMPSLAIDNAGLVYVIYYDAQNYSKPRYTDVYLAISNNGALKFDHYKLNEAPVKQAVKLQTQTTLLLKNENDAIIFGSTPGKNRASMFKIINDTLLTALSKKNKSELSFERTISFSEKINFSFSALNDTKITAVITKPLLAGFEKIVVKNMKVKKGNNILLMDSKELALKKGNYVLTLYYNGKNDFAWITEE